MYFSPTSKDLLLVAGIVFVLIVLVLLYNSGLARLLLHLVEFLSCGINRFLLAIDIALVLRAVFIKLGGVAQAGARIAIIGGRTQAKFALFEVEFVVQGIELLFLLVELFLPLIRRLPALGSSLSGIAGGFCGWFGGPIRRAFGALGHGGVAAGGTAHPVCSVTVTRFL